MSYAAALRTDVSFLEPLFFRSGCAGNRAPRQPSAATSPPVISCIIAAASDSGFDRHVANRQSCVRWRPLRSPRRSSLASSPPLSRMDARTMLDRVGS